MLTFETLRAANLSRRKLWMGKMVKSWTLSDWGVAMAGEAGEACNVIKKINRVRSKIVGSEEGIPELLEDLKNKLADIVIYIDLLAASENIDLAEAIVHKYNEVSKRHNFNVRITND